MYRSGRHPRSQSGRGYCHRLYALKDGVIVGEGAPKELLTPAFLREVYEVEAEVLTGRDGSLRVFFYPSRIS